jgi:hypothetical protein
MCANTTAALVKLECRNWVNDIDEKGSDMCAGSV